MSCEVPVLADKVLHMGEADSFFMTRNKPIETKKLRDTHLPRVTSCPKTTCTAVAAVLDEVLV